MGTLGRLVEQHVDRQAFFLSGRGDRTPLLIQFVRPLRTAKDTRGCFGRSPPPASRQGESEREHQRAERGHTYCWTDGTHCAPLRHGDTYNRSSAAREWHVVHC